VYSLTSPTVAHHPVYGFSTEATLFTTDRGERMVAGHWHDGSFPVYANVPAAEVTVSTDHWTKVD
jgi:hypothetical protein